jgi:hypothetical protein
MKQNTYISVNIFYVRMSFPKRLKWILHCEKLSIAILRNLKQNLLRRSTIPLSCLLLSIPGARGLPDVGERVHHQVRLDRVGIPEEKHLTPQVLLCILCPYLFLSIFCSSNFAIAFQYLCLCL